MQKKKPKPKNPVYTHSSKHIISDPTDGKTKQNEKICPCM